ncbi:hypothetical protein DUNSADRAFT_16199 [Dunaliella salina]|uniref:Damage-control phosphatase ARMT1-like metal-binding domain-containing protein n=1 Tax=Dunaliella salina TaxID=3046 RepID=A0ABQ7G475_DUNSA|nr:hypothetical protein DUNSADRAFT_16199 [Dunaliella salina]|eukprot:KAF5829354.1 hypothetical protein DUNSADRAFT_16199 [Dunaliella salina]
MHTGRWTKFHFGFSDAYRLEKERENAAALAVLHDLLAELDSLSSLEERLQALVQGALAANIFDWGAKACVALYQAGTILEIYREARAKLSKRPWALDHYDKFQERAKRSYNGAPGLPPYRRVLMFVDNSGADIVLGQLPFAREFLRMGCEVVLVANKLPAINDITATELIDVVASAERVCPIIRAARDAARRVESASGGMVPPYPGAQQIKRSGSHAKLPGLQTLAGNGGGNGGNGAGNGGGNGGTGGAACGGASSAAGNPGSNSERTSSGGQASSSGFASAAGVDVPGPKLYIVHNGQGSPCLDFRRVPDLLAEACSGADLIVIEGMGRAIHTNLNASFLCDSLKLAMIKTERLSTKLFGPHGSLYDCVCKYEEGKGSPST